MGRAFSSFGRQGRRRRSVVVGLSCAATLAISSVAHAAPELCNGIDDDGDGLVDEPGPAPDGIDLSPNPADPTQHIGDPCGSSQGACKPGAYGCVAGAFACTGGKGPEPEVCDCVDNDCDGQVDEPSEGSPPWVSVCDPDKFCAVYAGTCQCYLEACIGDFCCPGGFHPENAPVSGGSPADIVEVCLPNVCPCPDGGLCKGASCAPNPCDTVVCPPGLVCKLAADLVNYDCVDAPVPADAGDDAASNGTGGAGGTQTVNGMGGAGGAPSPVSSRPHPSSISFGSCACGVGVATSGERSSGLAFLGLALALALSLWRRR